MKTFEKEFEAEVKNLLKPYLCEEGNAEYLALKLTRLHNNYLMKALEEIRPRED